jgi:hypothetical protein
LFSRFAVVTGNVVFAPRIPLPRLASKKQMIPTPGKQLLAHQILPNAANFCEKKG